MIGSTLAISRINCSALEEIMDEAAEEFRIQVSVVAEGLAAVVLKVNIASFDREIYGVEKRFDLHACFCAVLTPEAAAVADF